MKGLAVRFKAACYWGRSLEKPLWNILDLRFEDKLTEQRFKKSLEPITLFYGLGCYGLCLTLQVFYFVILFFVEERLPANIFQVGLHDLRLWSALCALVHMAVTLVDITVSALRYFRNACQAWDLELLHLSKSICASMVLLFSSTWYLPRYYGVDPVTVWHGHNPLERESITMLGFFLNVLSSSVFLNMRIHLLLALHATAVSLYVISAVYLGPWGMMTICVNSTLSVTCFSIVLARAYFTEAEQRRLWLADEEVSRSHTAYTLSSSLARGLRCVAAALCDIVVELSEKADVVNIDPPRSAFFGCCMDGVRLASVMSETDQGRFEAILTKAAEARWVPQMLPVTLLCGCNGQGLESQLLVVSTQRAECRYLVGIRLDHMVLGEHHPVIDLQMSSPEGLPRVPPQVAKGTLLAHSLNPASPWSTSSFESKRAATPWGNASMAAASWTSQPKTLASSQPATLASAPLPPLHVEPMDLCHFEAQLQESVAGKVAKSTVLSAVRHAVDEAQGGLLMVIAAQHAFEQVFRCQEQGALELPGLQGKQPALRTSDAGYMTERLRGVHIADPCFAAAIRDFTAHSESDRWATDHPDAAARGQPKDGAFLLDTTGYRLKCAVKVLGLSPPCLWSSVGTKHEAALACAWAVPGSVVIVRSDSGMVHGLVRSACTVRAFKLSPEVQP